jgi:hypothetical protein
MKKIEFVEHHSCNIYENGKKVEKALKSLDFNVRCISKGETPNVETQTITISCSAGRGGRFFILEERISKVSLRHGKSASYYEPFKKAQLYKLHQWIKNDPKKEIRPIETTHESSYSIIQFVINETCLAMILNQKISQMNDNIEKINGFFRTAFFQKIERTCELQVPNVIQDLIFRYLSVSIHWPLKDNACLISQAKENEEIDRYLSLSTVKP